MSDDPQTTITVTLPYSDATGRGPTSAVLALADVPAPLSLRLVRVLTAIALGDRGLTTPPSATGDPHAVLAAYEHALTATQQVSADAAYAAERSRWAHEHGSPRLRLGLERGFDMDSTYTVERARAQFAPLSVHIGCDSGELRDIDDPSLAGIKLLDEVSVRLSAAGHRLPCRLVRVETKPAGYRLLDRTVPESVYVSGWLGRHELLIDRPPAAPVVPGSDDDIVF